MDETIAYGIRPAEEISLRHAAYICTATLRRFYLVGQKRRAGGGAFNEPARFQRIEDSALPQASDARFDGGDLIFWRARTCRDSHLGALVEPDGIELRSALDVMRVPAHRRAYLGKTRCVR